MSDRSERLFSAMSEISGDHIDEAAQPGKKPNRQRHWKRWGTAAACVTLAVMTVSIFPHLGGCGAGGNGESSSTAPEGEATAFMSYAGPVLPLTLSRENPAISAQREITLDFVPWEEEYGDTLLVQDQYVLTNSSAKEQTVTVQLPFTSTLSQLDQWRPELTLDGQQLETELLAGSIGPEMEFSTWEDYKSLLAGGSCRTRAENREAAPLHQPVTVYAFTDPWGPPESTKEVPNPTIQAGFDLDYDRTQVLTYGFNGGRNDWEEGHMVREFSIPLRREGPQEPALLVLLGEDVRNFATGAYVTGGSDPGTKRLENAGVTVRRYETDLDAVLRWMLQSWEKKAGYWDKTGDWVPAPELLNENTRYALLLEQMKALYGNEPGAINRGGDTLEDVLSMMDHSQRVFWAEAEVSIPTGGSRTLTATFQKEPSYDYVCSGTPNAESGLRGYDMMPWLDTNLTFSAQRATLEDRGLVEIARQNFGFDPETGVKQVDLSPDIAHYYLEVVRLQNPPES